MRGSDARHIVIGRVLESVTVLSSSIAAARHVPFHGRSLTRSQLEALHLLAHARTPLTPARLAAALHVTRGAVSQLLDGLRTEGLVVISPNPADARSRILTLSPDAAAEVTAFEAGVIAAVQPRFADLSTQELTALAGLLERIREIP